ncbi:MAG: membrane protein insertase YidC, partial [Gammaproteobacteria bacterium]|nr:membrane protein insertase YidC [Gammaproteobacteria bacterium]
MDYKKIALYAALVVIGMFLWNKWQFEHPPVAAPTATVSNASVDTTNSSGVPSVPQASDSTVTKAAPATSAVKQGKLIWVQTDVLKTAIDL